MVFESDCISGSGILFPAHERWVGAAEEDLRSDRIINIDLVHPKELFGAV